VLRNEVLPARIPPDGLVVVRDGDPGEPEVTLNPVTYLWQHRAEIEVVVEAATAAARDAALDALLVTIGATLSADPNPRRRGRVERGGCAAHRGLGD
jgi:hypothetical protein